MRKSRFLLIERFVLEALGKNEKNIMQIHLDTGIELGMLQNILYALVDWKVLKRDTKGIYKVRPKDFWEVDESEFSLKEELSELIFCFLDSYISEQRGNIKLQKVFMTEKEEKLFRSYMISMDTFVEDLRRKQAFRVEDSKKYKDTHVVFWGMGRYRDIVDSYLSSI